jgi:hypothetical protein
MKTENGVVRRKAGQWWIEFCEDGYDVVVFVRREIEEDRGVRR